MFLIVFSLATICFSFLVSTFFTKANSAAATGKSYYSVIKAKNNYITLLSGSNQITFCFRWNPILSGLPSLQLHATLGRSLDLVSHNAQRKEKVFIILKRF